MVTKVLHTGNIAVAFATVAQAAADVSLTGGAGAVITSALSALEIFKKAKPEDRELAKIMADAAQTHLRQAHVTGDRRKIVIQMMALHTASYEDMAKGNMDAPTVAKNICAQIKATAKDSEHRSATALANYQALLVAILTPLLEPPNASEAMQQELLRRTEVSGEAQRLRDIGITEKAIIRLAGRITTETDDVGQAWLDLQYAMDIAVRVQAEGQIQSHHGDFVDTVLKRVAELAKDGEYATASDEIDVALSQAEAQMTRLLDSGVEVALMDRNTAKAATLLVRKADMEAGGIAEFEAQRTLRSHYYEVGRDKGRNLDSALAIDLARLVLARATTADERGTAGNDLGNALLSLGERDSDTARLEQAIIAYTEALKERTRKRVPMDWAMTQMNLGNALLSLGERDSDTARLEQAVTAYTETLKESTRKRVPMQWAMAQMNLGNALLALGERDSDTARLEQAVTAYTEALKENTRDRVPMGWAVTQMNLGSALATLGERDSDTARLEQAVTAYTEALKERTRERVPMQWAMTQMNLGNALLALGERDSDTARLEQAVTAYTEALKECTRDRVPMQWAMTQSNLCSVEVAFFDRTHDPAHLDRALDYMNAAKEVFVSAGASQYRSMAQQQLDKISALRDAP
ncbi:tetratricopeptide repeat protein [Henriciella sp. AS95]|uniref:tetratricopeptide repeat protein n=1 Tax=Henriciella sp. AS95 TaxID=3135782 RepID=UPI00316FDC5E